MKKNSILLRKMLHLESMILHLYHLAFILFLHICMPLKTVNLQILWQVFHSSFIYRLENKMKFISEKNSFQYVHLESVVFHQGTCSEGALYKMVWFINPTMCLPCFVYERKLPMHLKPNNKETASMFLCFTLYIFLRKKSMTTCSSRH